MESTESTEYTENLNWTPVVSNSGSIDETAFDENKCLVKFKNGGIYEYDNVSPELYDEFLATHPSADISSGQFFIRNIRTLPFKKIS